ncbi:hypothetical protein PAEPH01_2502 [Pancytospora epiphaga]|nr:hypothetical protein PAEPH01_2502 [Pancytospora epiphaga]
MILFSEIAVFLLSFVQCKIVILDNSGVPFSNKGMFSNTEDVAIFTIDFQEFNTKGHLALNDGRILKIKEKGQAKLVRPSDYGDEKGASYFTLAKSTGGHHLITDNEKCLIRSEDKKLKMGECNRIEAKMKILDEDNPNDLKKLKKFKGWKSNEDSGSSSDDDNDNFEESSDDLSSDENSYLDKTGQKTTPQQQNLGPVQSTTNPSQPMVYMVAPQQITPGGQPIGQNGATPAQPYTQSAVPQQQGATPNNTPSETPTQYSKNKSKREKKKKALKKKKREKKKKEKDSSKSENPLTKGANFLNEGFDFATDILPQTRIAKKLMSLNQKKKFIED